MTEELKYATIEKTDGTTMKVGIVSAGGEPSVLTKVLEVLKNEAEGNENTQTLRAILDGERVEKPENQFSTIVATANNELPPEEPVVINSANSSLASDLNDEEAAALFTITQRIKAGEKFNIVAELPARIANLLRREALKHGIIDKQGVNKFARIMITELSAEINMDKEFSNLEKELNEALQIPSVVDMYSEHTKTMMEDDLLQKADRVEELNKTKAEELRKISKAYTDSYTLDRQKKLVETNPNIISKIRKFSSDKHFKRMCEDFDFKMAKTKFKVNAISSLVDHLMYILPISEEMARRYIVVLCKTCEKYHQDNIDEVLFMYYSVRNVRDLAYTSQTARTEFSSLVLNNIRQLIKLICQKEDEDCEV